MSNVAQRAAAQRQNGQVQQVQADPLAKDPLARLLREVRPQLSILLNNPAEREKFERMALTDLRTNKKLAEAVLSNPGSFFGAMLKAAGLGLQVANGLGHAYLIPFDKWAKENGRYVVVGTEIQMIIGYQGMIELARRSGQIETLYAVPAYKGEPFEVTLGLSQDIKHKKMFDGSVNPTAENLVAVYAVARLKGGGIQFEVMTKQEVDAIKARSKSKDKGPWETDYVEMAKKTVIRRLFKMLPVSVETKNEKGEIQDVTLSTVEDYDYGDALTDQPITVDEDGVILDHSNNQSTAFIGFKQQIQRCDSVASIDQILLQAEDMIDSETELDALRAEATMRRQELGALV